MVGALGIITTTIPVIIATWSIIKVTDVMFKNPKTGKPVGTVHYHKNKKTKRFMKHQHSSGHIKHEHPGMYGYGRTKNSWKPKPKD